MQYSFSSSLIPSGTWCYSIIALQKYHFSYILLSTNHAQLSRFRGMTSVPAGRKRSLSFSANLCYDPGIQPGEARINCASRAGGAGKKRGCICVCLTEVVINTACSSHPKCRWQSNQYKMPFLLISLELLCSIVLYCQSAFPSLSLLLRS